MHDDQMTRLRSRFESAASTIEPRDGVLLTARAQYEQRRRAGGVASAAVVGAIAAVAVVGAVAGPGLARHPGSERLVVPATSTATATATAAPAPAAMFTSAGLTFILPAGFSLTSGPTVTDLAPTASDPRQESGRSTVTQAEGGHRDLVVATYEGAVGAALNQRSRSPNVYGDTTAERVRIGGHRAVIGEVASVPPSACSPARAAASGRTCGDVRLPHITIDVELGQRLHLTLDTAGITRTEALNLVRSAVDI